ncbi:uncharacterized protein LOC26528607 [Drosophila mojavensis]|uniref:ZAD domain-containing protein n=1 Tax=Drosophila mojavensis TaxID=7230 RepID=A0A0Q9XA98_DROMO|nr:uncharacterized protein LOC26528607 [Drosophila mojavensis]KRG05340.1 uncharacterized protein Dmoj_GI26966 [Drosophila mojavensis]
MSEKEGCRTRRVSFVNSNDFDLTDCCRICKCRATAENGIKLRPLFNGRRLTRIIANTVHIEIKDIQGLPRFLCEKCLNILKTFSIFQVDFRRSEEDFKMTIEARRTSQMDALMEFSSAIEMEKQRENDQKSAALVTNFLKKTKKNKSKPKLQN